MNLELDDSLVCVCGMWEYCQGTKDGASKVRREFVDIHLKAHLILLYKFHFIFWAALLCTWYVRFAERVQSSRANKVEEPNWAEEIMDACARKLRGL